MRHTTGHDLQPADLVARPAPVAATNLAFHVYLEARFHEREETRPHAGPHWFAEYGVQNGTDQKLSGSQRHPLIDEEHLVLEEGPLVSGVGILVPVNAARIDEPERRFVFAHVADAGAGQMWAQAYPLSPALVCGAPQPERIHALASRMIGREVQIVELEQFGGDFRSRVDIEVEGGERVVEVVHQLYRGVQRTARSRNGWHRHVEWALQSRLRVQKHCPTLGDRS